MVSTLSGGQQQMVAHGAGLMSQPKLCIIDEPSSGLAPKVVDEIFEVIKKLRDKGIAFFWLNKMSSKPQRLLIRPMFWKVGALFSQATPRRYYRMIR